MKAKITHKFEATAKDMHEGHSKISWNSFFISVLLNYSSCYSDYPLMVSRNIFKNRNRDILITICLGVEDVEAR